MPEQPSGVNGLLIVDKPGLPLGANPSAWARLPTSHDIVQQVRRLSRQRRIGHTGTLDPMASGVLVLCLGNATRLVEYYQGHDKRYLAEICLGRKTDTYDALGQTVEEQPVPALDRAQIEAALAHFVGAIEQKPPIYSALKQDGESLHRKARRGEEVEVDARPVTIHALDLVELRLPDRLLVRVHCSAGTYVRSLAHDLGESLGTCAHLSYLRREAVGRFQIAETHTPTEIEAAVAQGRFAELLRAPGFALDLPEILVNRTEAERLGFGQKVWLEAVSIALTTELVQAVDPGGQLLGVLRLLERSTDQRAVLCKAEKWLASQKGD